jgi:hypothetical protein
VSFSNQFAAKLPSHALQRLAVAFATVLLLVALAPASAYAADPVVTSIDIEAPDHLTVGDRVRFVIKVEADRDTTFALAPGGLHDVMGQTGPLEQRTRNLDGGRVEVTLTFEAAPFAPGTIDLPPIGLRYQGPNGTQGELTTPATRLVVESVLPESGEVTLRDLKPQAEIAAPSSPIVQVLVSLTLALLAVIGLIVWRLRRRGPVEAAPQPSPEELTAEDRARRILDGAAELLEKGDFAAYYSTLSSAVRSYLTERFGFPAFALTTTEMQERMVRQGMDRWQARIVGGLLNQCDAVVFASYRPAPERADADLTAAYEIVEMSRPVEGEREEVGVS